MTDRDVSAAVAILCEELRQARVAAGHTQEGFGAKVFVSRALVGMYETGQRTPTLDYCQAVDQALGTTMFERMRKKIGAQDARERLGGVAELEARAAAIRTYSPVVMPGLLQTEAYMRHQFSSARLNGATPADIESLVETRLKRQRVLSSLRSYQALIDESVLLRTVGNRETARRQVEHLLALAQTPRLSIQVVPLAAVSLPPIGPLTVFDLTDGQQAIHLDAAVGGSGTTSRATEVVRTGMQQFEIVHSCALSLLESARILEARIKELT